MQYNRKFYDYICNNHTIKSCGSRGNIFGAGWLANQEEEGADKMKHNENKSAHFIETFTGNIDDLQEGTYEWNEDKQEWICTSCKND